MPGGVFPGDDRGAVEEDLHALAGGEGGADAGVVVGDVDAGLGRDVMEGSGIESFGLLGAGHGGRFGEGVGGG